MHKEMTIIDAIRTLRKECDMSFEEARDKAIEHFRKTNRPIPDSINSMYRKGKPVTFTLTFYK